jgi:hypothetical protein
VTLEKLEQTLEIVPGGCQAYSPLGPLNEQLQGGSKFVIDCVQEAVAGLCGQRKTSAGQELRCLSLICNERSHVPMDDRPLSCAPKTYSKPAYASPPPRGFPLCARPAPLPASARGPTSVQGWRLKFGAEILLDDRLSADCPWRDDPRGTCGARFAEMPPTRPPDLPGRLCGSSGERQKNLDRSVARAGFSRDARSSYMGRH